MKTSNYISIAYLVFLFGGVFMLFLAAKIDPRGYYNQEFLSLEKPLDNFSVVIAEAGADIRLKSGQTSKISLQYPKGDTCSLPPFFVRNDTLFVSSYPEKEKQKTVEVECNGIKSIQGKEKSQVSIENFHTDTLSIKLSNAELDAYFDNAQRSTTLLFSILAEESKINLKGANIENLDVLLNKTKIRAWNNSIGSLSGTLTNQSEIQIHVMKKINLEVDSTSNYNLLK